MRTINTNIRPKLSSAGSLMKQPQVKLCVNVGRFLGAALDRRGGLRRSLAQSANAESEDQCRECDCQESETISPAQSEADRTRRGCTCRDLEGKVDCAGEGAEARTARRIRAEKYVVALRSQRRKRQLHKRLPLTNRPEAPRRIRKRRSRKKEVRRGNYTNCTHTLCKISF